MGDLGEVPELELTGQGVVMGSFLVLPVLTVESSYNDNVFATDGGKNGDYVTSIIPALGIESLWSRHFVSVGVFGKINRYADLSSEDDEEYGVAGSGRLDLSSEATVLADLELGRRTIRRANSENSGRTGPEQLDFVNFDLGYRREFGRFRLDLDPFVQRRNYVESSDNDRDRTQIGATPRIWYRFSPAFSVFFEPGVKDIDYDRKVDDAGAERNSLTLHGFVGAEFDITSIIDAAISLGPVHSDFDESSFNSFTTVGARGAVTWDVTELTRVKAEVVRRVAPTNIEGASSKIQTLGRVRLRHKLLPELFLSVDGAFFREDFRGIGREDDNYRIRASAEYLINRFVSIGAGYNFRIRNSNVPAEDFTRNVFTLAIELRR